MENVFDMLSGRGFIEQSTDEHALRRQLSQPVTCYVGFDPTASTLHVGHLLPIMALMHMQKAGHRVIALVGGGTGMIGDPSGKTKMREILTKEKIESNVRAIKVQLARYLDFSEDRALLVNNADWLCGLGYIDFLRDIGCHFSVNRMLAAESYKARMKTGLNFIEFNYMLLQAYDFLHLNKHCHCVIQMGGNDQWGNIVAGIDLIRRVEGNEAYGMTFPLIVTASGHKMGKTEEGAVWLDESATSAYQYYQYWVNVDDADVVRFLKLFTFLPLEEIEAVSALEGSEFNRAKMILAFEATKITHGEEQALGALKTASGAFGFKGFDGRLLPSSSIPRGEVNSDLSSMPTSRIEREVLEKGISAYELFTQVGLCSSRSEARRLIGQKGGYINGQPVEKFDEMIKLHHVRDGSLILRSGKKKYHQVVVK
jgi:tyrosyl-tRNA synthetase